MLSFFIFPPTYQSDIKTYLILKKSFKENNMKRLILFIFIILITFIFSGCNNTENTNVSSASEVVINIPTDDTVNGYRTESKLTEESSPNKISGSDVGITDSNEIKNNSKEYCANKNSKVFHKSSCTSVSSMKDNNKYFADRDTLITKGYKPCGKCNP